MSNKVWIIGGVATIAVLAYLLISEKKPDCGCKK